jgi:hypothetical protein
LVALQTRELALAAMEVLAVQVPVEETVATAVVVVDTPAAAEGHIQVVVEDLVALADLSPPWVLIGLGRMLRSGS